jgi:hypothetical protein
MPVDSSIYGQFAAPAKSTADYAAQYDAADARRMALQQNALALQSGRQKAEEYTRGVNEAGTLRNALMGLGAGATDEQRIQAMRGTGLPGGYTQADALQRTLIERDATLAKTRESQAKALTEITGAVKRYATGVIANPSQQTALAAINNMEAMHKQFGLPGDFDSERQQVMQMVSPDQIRQWAAGHMGEANLVMQKFVEQTNGKVKTFPDMNPITNPGGPAPITMTTTPESDQTAATALAGQRSVAATAAAGRDQAERHFNTTQDAAAKDVIYDPERGVLVSKATGLARPAATIDGTPLGAKDKPLPEAAQKQIMGTRNLQDAVANYRSKLAEFGKVDMLSPDARAKMGNAYNNMMLQAKEAYNLGVLNGPDYDILQSVVKDPTKMGAAITSRAAMDAQASELSRIAAGIEKTAMEAHGKAYKPRDVPGGGGKTVRRTGTSNGRKVIEYSDGSIAYAD